MTMLSPRSRGAGLSLLLLTLTVSAEAQNVRVACWNISHFTGSNRLNEIRTVMFQVGPNGSMDPDILVAQEIQSPSAANVLLGALNTAQPNTWAVTFGSLTGTGSTSDTAVFYKQGKVTLAGSPVKVAPAGGVTGQPRDTWRFDFRAVGNADAKEIFAIYNVHMKSGSNQEDIDRRQIEALNIRANSDSLPGNYQIILAGDLNMQASTQLPYQTLTQVGGNARGRFRDPISSPGTWENSAAFRFLHTQDPIGAGGMDSRHDQILVDSDLVDGTGTEYVGVFGLPYSTSTWNDPNHSYRAWGNDGTSFNSPLTITNNQMVGSTIAQAIVTCAGSGGHIPVFLDISYNLSLPISGSVALGNYVGAVGGTVVNVEITPSGSPTVLDSESVALAANGSFAATTSVAPGSYDVYVKGSHWLRRKVASVTITLQGASGLSYSLVNGDVNGDNNISLADFSALRSAFGSSTGSPNWNPNADLNGDGSVSLGDFVILRQNFGQSGD